MKRLTERTADGILVKVNYSENVLRTFYQCFDGKPNANYSNCEEGYCAMEKLAAYEDAEDQGLLLWLPYPLGTEHIYFIDKSDMEIYELDAKKIEVSLHDISKDVMYTIDYYDFLHEDFGEVVFLTREEAEAKLAEMEGAK